MVVTVGLSEASVLEEFYNRRSNYYFAARVTTALFAVFTVLLVAALGSQRRSAILVARSHARLLATFSQAAVGIAHCRLDGSFIDVNQKLCDILGYRRIEFQALTIAAITHPDDVAETRQLLQDLLASPVYPASLSWEKRCLHKDGSIRWTCLTVSLIHDERSEPDYYAAIVEDITGRKQMEEDLRAHEEEQNRLIRQAERQREQLVEAQAVGNVGSWETDLQDMTLTWSEQTYRIFEVDPASFQPSYARFLELIHVEDREKVDAALASSIATRQAGVGRTSHPRVGWPHQNAGGTLGGIFR